MLFTICLSSNSQDLTSGELLERGYIGAWTNTIQGSAGGYSGGWTPAYNVGTDTVIFGYTTASVSQTKAINTALNGAGIQVIGYNYAWKINNNDMNTGTLTGVVSLKGSTGNVLESYSYNYNARTSGLSENFQQFSGTQAFSQIYSADALGSISVTFTGKDDRYWAGFYGPRVRDPHLTLNYRSDPCANNPAFGPQCAGFNDLLTSINLVPYPNAVATHDYTVVNSFPIATVLSSSGSGLSLHGFKYGFTYELKDPYCSSSFLGLFCTGVSDSAVAVIAGATDSTGKTIFNNTHTFVGSNSGPQEMNYQYLFPKSTNTNLMGNFTYAAAVEGNGSVYNMYAKMIVTPDPCIKNVMYSSSCTGFQEAIDKLNGTNKTDYATTGYTEPASVTAGTASVDAITYTTSPTGSTVQASPQQTAAAPSPTPAPTQQTTQSTSSSTSSSSTSVASSTASAGTVTTSDKAVAAPANLSFAMNLISKNAEKEKAIAMTAVATAVEQAQSAGTQAQQEAVSVATKASEASVSTSTVASSSSGTSTVSSDNKSTSGGNSLSLQNFAGMGAVQLQSGPQMQQQTVTTSNTANTAPQQTQQQVITAAAPITTTQQLQQQQISQNVQIVSPITQISQQSFDVQANYSIVPVMQVASLTPAMSQPAFTETIQQSKSFQELSYRQQVEVETPQSSTNFITDRTNPLREIIEGQPLVTGISMEQQMSTVKKEVAINEAAVGIDIGKIALAPVGYNSYLSLTIKDVSFYAPREIYPKQNTVDNVRALRQMSSDTLHRQMVEQQYK